MRITRAGKFTLVAPLIVFMFFLPQVPGCVMANTAKRGRIIDADTGKGIPGAFVLGSARFSANGFGYGAATGYAPYRSLTKTDDEGYFKLPSTWSNMKFALPGFDAREYWFVTAYVPGYVVEGDEASARPFDKFDAPKGQPNSVAHSPEANWFGFWISLKTIRLRREDMSSREALIYFGQIMSAGLGQVSETSPMEVALRETARSIFKESICSRDPQETLDNIEGGTYALISEEGYKYAKELARLEPAGRSHPGQPVFHAGSICEALENAENK